MKTTYWYAKIETDSDCYSVREKSKKAAIAQLKQLTHHRFGPLVKVTVEGRSLFEILKEALSEGGLLVELEAHLNNKEIKQDEFNND